MFKKSVLLSLILAATVANAATTTTTTSDGLGETVATTTTTDAQGNIVITSTAKNKQGETTTSTTTAKPSENPTISTVTDAKDDTVVTVSTTDQKGETTSVATSINAQGNISTTTKVMAQPSSNNPASGSMTGNDVAIPATTRRPYFKSQNTSGNVSNGNTPGNNTTSVAAVAATNRQSTAPQGTAGAGGAGVALIDNSMGSTASTTAAGSLSTLGKTDNLATVATPFAGTSSTTPTTKQRKYSALQVQGAKAASAVAATSNSSGTEGVAGLDDFSSDHNPKDRAEQFIVPRNTVNGFVKPQSQVIKSDGTDANERLKSDVGRWQARKNIHENNITVNHVGYPLRVSSLELVGEPQDVKLDTQALLAPYHGVIQSRDDLMTLATAVNQAYLAQGIALATVSVPQQKNDGTVVMNVSFERIIETSLRGETGKSGSWMQYYLDQMKAVYPIQKAPIERYTLLMDQLPGISINTYAQPILTDQGAITGVNEIVDSEYTPFNGYIALSNGNSDYVGPYLLQGGMTWNQPTGPDSLAMDAAKSAPIAHQLTYYDFKYNRFLTKNDLQLGLFYSHADTEPGGIYSTYNLNGESDVFTTSLTQPWILTQNVRLSNTLSVTNVRANSIYNSFGLESYNDKLTVVELATDLGFRQGRSWNQASLSFNATGPWMGAQRDPSNPSVAGYDGQSFDTRLALTRTQYFTDNFSFLAGVTGQYSRSTLANPQELSYGGALYGRAFTSSGFGGSNGYIGRIQANYNLGGIKPSLNGITPYSFYDMGELYTLTNAQAPSERYAASSAGVGVGSAIAKNWYLDTYVAKPVTHNQNFSVDNTARWIFSVVGNF